MKNRNMMIFVVLSILLLGGYNLLMTRLVRLRPRWSRPRPRPARSGRPRRPRPPRARAGSGRGRPRRRRVDPMARVSLGTTRWNLTWRKGDGALVQVEWSDGTKFFPEARSRQGRRGAPRTSPAWAPR